MKYLKKHKAYILLIYAFLLAIHFVLKDKIYPISVLFYAFPLFIIIAIGIFVSIIFFNHKKTFYFIVIGQLLLIIYWFNYYYSFAEVKPETTKTSCILFWNVAKKEQLPINILVKNIKEENISNIALVEAENITQKNLLTLKEKLPDFNFKKLKGNMFFGSLNIIKNVNYTSKDKSYKFNLIETENKDLKIEKILIIDIYANPFFNRKTPLENTFKYIKNSKTDIIVGDFNTPFNSIHFSEYKNNFKSFHGLSKGSSATWAYGLPLLELDHIWVNKKYIPVSLTKKNYKVSDHQMLIANYFKQ